ncbi:MAG: ABC transporter substrate-binding protein [Syntrophomonas sp.]|nr:ABC transporter substrate-binding protein [Syntrophomonas sp.]
MRKLFKTLRVSKIIVAIFMISCLLLTGCSGTKSGNTAPATRVVQDGSGKDVTIPATVSRVAPGIGAFAQMTEMLGGKGTIVASVTTLSDEFKKVFPDFLQSNPNGRNSANIEDIIAAKAQVVYGPTYTDEQIAQLKAAGIAVVPIKAFSTVEEMKKDVLIIASILGGDAPAKAAKFNAYYDGNIKYVQDKTSSLKDADKVKILSLNYSAGNYSTINSTDIGSVYMVAAGGINAAASYTGLAGSTTGTTMNVNTEQIVKWAPDVIITSSKASQAQILKEATLATVPAIKNKKVYVVPTGTYLWSVRSGEGALQPLWLAKTMYPDIFSDLDMSAKVKDFYETFYGYNIQPDEIKAILNGDLAMTTLTR